MLVSRLSPKWVRCGALGSPTSNGGDSTRRSFGNGLDEADTLSGVYTVLLHSVWDYFGSTFWSIYGSASLRVGSVDGDKTCLIIGSVERDQAKPQRRCYCLGAIAHSELLEEVTDVGFHRVIADKKHGGDFFVRKAASDEV